MEEYSIKKNLKFMGEVYYSPNKLIDKLVEEDYIHFYSFIPIIIFLTAYEFLVIFDFIFNMPLIPLPKLIPISDEEYRFFQIFFFPIVNLLDFIIFYAILYYISRIIKDQVIDALKITCFFAFIWCTLGILAFFLDLINHFLYWEYLSFIHPICGIINAIYTIEFTYRQSEIKKWKVFLLLLPSLIVFLSFRMLFIR